MHADASLSKVIVLLPGRKVGMAVCGFRDFPEHVFADAGVKESIKGTFGPTNIVLLVKVKCIEARYSLGFDRLEWHGGYRECGQRKCKVLNVRRCCHTAREVLNVVGSSF
jgi:hypothetical protein